MNIWWEDLRINGEETHDYSGMFDLAEKLIDVQSQELFEQEFFAQELSEQGTIPTFDQDFFEQDLSEQECQKSLLGNFFRKISVSLEDFFRKI